MNKLVTLPIGDVVKIKRAHDKTARIAAEVKEAERHARRNGTCVPDEFALHS